MPASPVSFTPPGAAIAAAAQQVGATPLGQGASAGFEALMGALFGQAQPGTPGLGATAKGAKASEDLASKDPASDDQAANATPVAPDQGLMAAMLVQPQPLAPTTADTPDPGPEPEPGASAPPSPVAIAFAPDAAPRAPTLTAPPTPGAQASEPSPPSPAPETSREGSEPPSAQSTPGAAALPDTSRSWKAGAAPGAPPARQTPAPPADPQAVANAAARSAVAAAAAAPASPAPEPPPRADTPEPEVQALQEAQAALPAKPGLDDKAPLGRGEKADRAEIAEEGSADSAETPKAAKAEPRLQADASPSKPHERAAGQGSTEVAALTHEPARPEAPAAPVAAAPAIANAAPPPHAPAIGVRGSPETVANLAAQIIKKLDGRSTRFDLELTPAGLGRVDVRVEIGAEGRLTAAMACDNPQAAAELRSRAHELGRALEQAGFDISGGLSFDVAGDPGRSNQNNPQYEPGSGQDAWRGRAFQAALDATAEAAPPPLAALELTGRRVAGLDIRI